jgi:hypothetical protein
MPGQHRKHLRGASQLFCLVGIIVCLVTSSPAQVDPAGLNGTVTDPSRRVVPQTTIVAICNNVFDAREPLDNLNPTQPPFHLLKFLPTFRRQQHEIG